MISLYYIGFALLLCAVGPFLLWKKKARAGLWQKLGIVPARVIEARMRSGDAPRLWFHAVSVGEFNAILPLLQALHAQYEDASVFVSTTTATGQKLAQERVGSWATVFYFPYDLPWSVNAWLNAVQPHLAIIAETEIWPGFTHECNRRNIKLCCVNGRISPRSYKGYMNFRPFFASVLAKFSALGVQGQEEAQRYISLGANPKAVHVTGNLKFDGITGITKQEQLALREELRIEAEDFVMVAGSTHEGEEFVVIDCLRRMRIELNEATPRLIIAPRHPERFARVCQIVESAGFTPRRFSRGDTFVQAQDVYVLDTIGQLNRYYAAADVAFVGGTIAPIGGHSLIEPYAYAVPVVCGPHTEKTRDIARNLLACGALAQVRDTDALTREILDLAKNPTARTDRGRKGQNYLLASQGAVQRSLRMLAEYFPQPARDGARDQARELSSPEVEQPVAAASGIQHRLSQGVSK
jgi:3-deoxy-D-manno-octulosonic-acid transferase